MKKHLIKKPRAVTATTNGNGLRWNDIYGLFETIAERCWDAGPEAIHQRVSEFYSQHADDPLFQEAYRRWSEASEID